MGPAQRDEIEMILEDFLSDLDLRSIRLPKDLRLPESPEESDRQFHFIHLDLMGKAVPLVESRLGRGLIREEADFVSERLQAFLESPDL